jgi:mono/diheme cytochrome c family protein
MELPMAHLLSTLTGASLAILFASLPAAAQTSPAAERGHAYARAHCADCHVVDHGGPNPAGATAPSFSAIAATPGMTSMAINAWFVSNHRNMPNFIIPERDREDLLAWFGVLRDAHKQGDTPH